MQMLKTILVFKLVFSHASVLYCTVLYQSIPTAIIPTQPPLPPTTAIPIAVGID